MRVWIKWRSKSGLVIPVICPAVTPRVIVFRLIVIAISIIPVVVVSIVVVLIVILVVVAIIVVVATTIPICIVASPAVPLRNQSVSIRVAFHLFIELVGEVAFSFFLISDLVVVDGSVCSAFFVQF